MKNTSVLRQMPKAVALVIILSMMINLAACGARGNKNTTIATSSDADKESETGDDTQSTSETETETETETEGESSTPEEESTTEENTQGEEETSANTGNSGYTDSGFVVNDPDNTRGLSETRVGFGCGNASDGKPHASSVGTQVQIDKFENVEALVWDSKTTEKVIYLTFDCGYEYNGNSLKILDVLKEKDVKAAFFCTLPFLKGNTESVGRMINEGHIVGNHSTTHPSFATISRSKMASELWNVHKWLLDNYNYTCTYFRPPMGEYTESSLELTTSVGYRSVFWSFAYKDWETANQPSVEDALQTMKNRLHPGEVMLLHAVSDSNVAALGDFIDYAREQGYTFKTLDDYEW